MPNTLVTDLQALPALNILAAGTYGRGAWEILISLSKIRGWIFDDIDGHGIPGKDAKGMADVTVFLDVDGDRLPGDFELTTTTDATGNYAFDDVPAGTYDLRQIPPVGYVQTTRDFGSITVAGSEILGRDFGNHRSLDLLRARQPYKQVADLNALPGRKDGEAIGRKGESEQERRGRDDQ